MPADVYLSFSQLATVERAGIDYQIVACPRRSPFAVIAPHGGGIEPGTSELARAIAEPEFSLYCFEGLKSTGNDVLHITSTRFDEPACLAVIAASRVVLALHGCDENREVVLVGGADEMLAASLRDALAALGIAAQHDRTVNHPGRLAANICNRGQSGRGCQLEISKRLRHTFFTGLTRSQRAHPTDRFRVFVAAVRRVLLATSSP